MNVLITGTVTRDKTSFLGRGEPGHKRDTHGTHGRTCTAQQSGTTHIKTEGKGAKVLTGTRCTLHSVKRPARGGPSVQRGRRGLASA
jgi:hypothetical protein